MGFLGSEEYCYDRESDGGAEGGPGGSTRVQGRGLARDLGSSQWGKSEGMVSIWLLTPCASPLPALRSLMLLPGRSSCWSSL